MATPGVQGWQNQILSGINAPLTPQNMRALNAWAQAEGGTAANNPFNTTQPMPGATPYNTLDSGGHVYNYGTPQQGIQATIQTLLGQIGNYGPIRDALRAGTNPMAVAQAIAGSQWGTGSGVERVLGGQVPTQINSATPNLAPMPPAQPAVPGASPRLPQVNMPPAPSPPTPSLPTFQSPGLGATPDISKTILNSITGGANLNDMTDAIIHGNIAASDAAMNAPMSSAHMPTPPHLTTPVQQSKTPVATATTPNGTKVQVEGKPDAEDQKAVRLAEHFIGTPYSWGGGGPSGPSYGIQQGANTKGFDCSSLVQYVWSKLGADIPRTTYKQFQDGKPVAEKDLQPGDAVYFTGSDPQNGLPGHVGLFIGNGKFVEAPHTGADIRISTLAGRSDYVGARNFDNLKTQTV